jgi:hypothetical protein
MSNMVHKEMQQHFFNRYGHIRLPRKYGDSNSSKLEIEIEEIP